MKDFFSDIFKDIASDLGSRVVRKLVWGFLLGDTFLLSPLLIKLDFLGLIQSKGIMFSFIVYFLMILGICVVIIFFIYFVRSIAFSKSKGKDVVIKRQSHKHENMSKIEGFAYEKGITSQTATRVLSNRKILTSELAKLIDFAVNDALIFSEGVQYPGEPSIDEQYRKAFEGGKKLMEYYKSERVALYFSESTSDSIVELYELISICLNKMIVAGKDIKLWNEYSEKLQKVKILRKVIFSEFREILES